MKEPIEERRLVQDMIMNFPAQRGDEEVLLFLDQQANEVKRFTFHELRQQCINTARYLVNQVSRGEVVLLPIEDQSRFVIGFFACLLAGCVPAPLSPIPHKRDRTGVDRILGILNESDINKVLATEEQKAGLEEWLNSELTKSVKVISLTTSTVQPAEKAALPDDIVANDLAYIQYTSGSTSSPKGVMLTHRQVLANLAKMYRVFERPERVRVVGWLPFYHDMGLVGHLFTVLYESGFGAFLPPSSFLAAPHLWFQALHDYQGTAAAAPTFALKMSARKVNVSEEWNLSRFKHLYVGSETVSYNILETFMDRFAKTSFEADAIKPVYGLAESTLLVAGGGVGFDELQSDFIDRPVGSGKRKLTPYKMDNEVGTIQIKDAESGKELEEGQEGEIFIQGPFNSRGYFGAESGNAYGSENAIIASGDIGFVTDGYLYITGRKKEIVIVRGVNYNAEDLEFAIQYNQELLETNDLTACMARIEPEKEEFLVFQEVHRHTSADRYDDIIKSVQANLSESYGITADAVFLIPRGMLPKTPNHKISRKRCLALLAEGKLTTLHTSSSDTMPTSVAEEEDPVVVVGMACRFPGGANSPEEFWEDLIQGVDGISEVPQSRWNNKIFYDRKVAVPGRMNTKWSGFTEDIDLFDPHLFGISPYEAPEIDPQQRMLLETSWRLLENTGWTKEDLTNSDTGVFVGIANNDYLYMKIKLTPDMNGFNAYSGLGNSNSVAANRLSYFYDLKGPSLAVDTACSSSLTAFHLGVQAIREGDCKQAIVGGVNVILSPGTTITLSQFGMMSPVGRCKAFDSSADGYVRSEGCGLVMLKRQSEAIKDGDTILAVVRGSSIGQDGNSTGITYPNGAAQRKLINRTLHEAGLQGEQINYMEAHGTGTPTGDPVEMEQISQLYGVNAKDKCYVGSVKANIGHLETAAGIAGVIKVLLMLQNKQVPPQIHVKQINPRIHLDDTRLEIPTEKQEWNPEYEKRRGAISSFGFGGSLAHVILEEPDSPNVQKKQDKEVSKSASLLFPLSAHTSQGMVLQARKWVNWLEQDTDAAVEDIVYTQAVSRSHLKYRKAFIVEEKADIKDKLEQFISAAKKPKVPSPEPEKIGFLFTGQGEQYAHMGKAFYDQFPVFKEAFDRCAQAVDLENLSFQQLAFELPENEMEYQKYQQVIQFAVQYALGTIWQACGLIPSVVLGHSLGEYAAACLAGCFDPETGMKLLMKRAELIDSLAEKGKMITIFTRHENVEEVLNQEKAQIAAINSAGKTVVSGESKEVERVVGYFTEKGVVSHELPIKVAFHSQLLDPILEPFREFVSKFTFKRPVKRWVSTTTGKEETQAPGTNHWVNHLRHTVQFTTSTQVLAAEGVTYFVEVGPGANTLLAVRECLDNPDLLLLRSLGAPKGKRKEYFHFLDSLGKLYEDGRTVHWQTLIQGTKRPEKIPGIVFDSQSYWVKGLEAENIAAFAGPIYQSDYKPTPVSPAVNGHKNDPSIHYDLEWIQKGHLPPLEEIEEVRTNISWIVLGVDTPLLQTLLKKIKERVHQVFWVSVGDKDAHKPDAVFSHTIDDTTAFDSLNKIVTSKSRANVEGWKVVYLLEHSQATTLESGAEEIKTATQNTLGAFIPFLKALNRVVITPPLWVVTEGSQRVKTEEATSLNLVAAPLWGFAKTLYLEHPEWRGGMIDLEAGGDPDEKVSLLMSKVLQPENESCIAIRNGNQYVEQLVSAKKQLKKRLKFRDDGAFIITGGLGGLGLESASWAVEKGAKHLVLISRRKMPDRALWDTIESDHKHYSVIQKLQMLEEKGATVELVSMDICNVVMLEGLFNNLKEQEVPVRGILHAAGVNWFSKIMQLNRMDFFNTLDIKISATWALHQLSKSHDLDCFILYSSVSALWGSVNLSHYTAANFFMDALSLYRSGYGQKALSINWGPWDEVGMSAKAEEREVLGKMGFSLMPPQEALRAMGLELATSKPLSLISRIDWEKYRSFIDFTLQPSLFEQVATYSIANIYGGSRDHLDHILEASPEKARERIEEVVRTELRSVMLIESMDHIPEDQRFNFLGMDSLMAILLATKLEEYFHVKLPNTLAYNYPHIRAVTDHLFELVYEASEGVGEPVIKQQTGQPTEESSTQSMEEGNSVPAGNWFKVMKKPEGETNITLYCFPYAGSGPEAFQSWSTNIHPGIKLIGILPPGKGDRAAEKPYASMHELVSYLANAFTPPEGPYAFYGHSLGALTAYECYVALKKVGKRTPDHLFLSGSNAPRVREDRFIHELPDEDFIDVIMEKYEDNSQDSERRLALERTADILRKDMQVLETYQPSEETVDAPMMIIVGESDTLLSSKKVRKWALLSEKDFSISYIPGGHNLVNEQQTVLLNLIEGQLSNCWSDEITYVLEEFANAK